MIRWRPLPALLGLSLLTFASVAVHGYHLAADDADIYLPAVKKIINPGLYPFGNEFFQSHAKLSQFAAVVAGSARLTHSSGDLVFFLWHIATVFLFLLAIWQLATVCFESARARWSGTIMIAALLTVPAAGTALVIMDPYLTARSASSPFSVFAVAAMLSGRRGIALLWLALVALVHPQMAFYTALFLAVLLFTPKWTLFTEREQAPKESEWEKVAVAGVALIPGDFGFGPLSPDYRRALQDRTFMFLYRWTWYECMGVAAPLALLYWLGRNLPRGARPAYARVARAAVLFGILATMAGVVLSSSTHFDSFARIQPMRAFHLIYIVFFLLLGGLLGEYVLRSRVWRWAGLYSAIAAGMFLVQRDAYAHSRHIEWPWASPVNPWVSAFLWARANTPVDAIFALDPRYMELHGEDQHGFRAIAERSVLTDYFKDGGVVSLFPRLAAGWQRQQLAQQGFAHFKLADFQKLSIQYPVSWVIVQGRAPAGLECPYGNSAVSVCHIPGARGWK